MRASLLALGVGACAAPAGDTAAPDALPAGVTLGPVQACAAPAAAPAWVESAEAWGLTAPPTREETAGVVVADLDDDGWLDVARLADGRVGPLSWGGPDGFTPGGAPLRFDAGPPSLADLDGDGRFEVLFAGPSPHVYDPRADAAAPLELVGAPPGALWRELRALDADGDGDTDLYAARTEDPRDPGSGLADALVLQEGGALVVAPDALPAGPTARMSFDVVRTDLDGDAVPELLLVHDMGAEHGGNALVRPGPDGWTDAAADFGLDHVMDGMGGHLSDLDGDGALDLLLTDTGRTWVLLDRGGSFVDVTAAWGADPVADPLHMGWGAIGFDADHDGQRELLVLQGPFLEPGAGSAEPQPYSLLRRTADGVEDVSAWLPGERAGTWRAAVADDLNGDGVLDVLLTRATAAPRLYLSQGCTAAAWLAVHAPDGSHVVVEAGGRQQVALVSLDSGFGANRRPVAWFGLGDAEAVDAVTVTLPWTGEARRVAGPLAPRRHLVVAP